jgi:hypothetical protein
VGIEESMTPDDVNAELELWKASYLVRSYPQYVPAMPCEDGHFTFFVDRMDMGGGDLCYFVPTFTSEKRAKAAPFLPGSYKLVCVQNDEDFSFVLKSVLEAFLKQHVGEADDLRVNVNPTNRAHHYPFRVSDVLISMKLAPESLEEKEGGDAAANYWLL